jgi:glyoxylase-like metal-dependent hydrolase (beta-lactamase superfamily II)
MGQKAADVSEVASDVYRVATYHEPWRCSVNQYLVVDEQPTLISTGLREHFEDTVAGIAEVLDPTTITQIVIPHFESDECGALNDFLLRAPKAVPMASMRACLASLTDFSDRPPRALGDGVGIERNHRVAVPLLHNGVLFPTLGTCAQSQQAWQESYRGSGEDPGQWPGCAAL